MSLWWLCIYVWKKWGKWDNRQTEEETDGKERLRIFALDLLLRDSIFILFVSFFLSSVFYTSTPLMAATQLFAPCGAKNNDKYEYVSVVAWPGLMLGTDSYRIPGTTISISFTYFKIWGSAELCLCFRHYLGAMFFHFAMNNLSRLCDGFEVSPDDELSFISCHLVRKEQTIFNLSVDIKSNI